MKHIVNQDRERVYEIGDNAVFYSQVVVHDGVFYGINLMMNEKSLGTFDTPLEVISEIERILACKEDVYTVTGFSQGGFAEW